MKQWLSSPGLALGSEVKSKSNEMLTLSIPAFAYIELTSQCNNRCPSCGNVFDETATPPLSAAQWCKVLLKLATHVLRLRLTGGEPTLHPEFEAIVGTARELEIPFALFTNARWRDPDGVIRLLRDSPCFAGLLISLHGPDPESHDAFTDVPGSFEETCTNIRRAVAAGLPVSTSTILTRLNCDRVAEVVQLSQELGVAHAVFNRYLTARADHLTPTNDQLITAMHDVDAQREAGATVRFSVCTPQCFYPSSSTGCLAGIAYCTVDPWGNVRPCNHAPLICGNLLEQSIEEIWHGSEMQRWREMIPAQCYDCLEFPKCHGGCRAVAMVHGLEKDPLIGKPILEKAQEPSEELVLYERAYPVGHFAMRPEPFGYMLVRGNRVTPVRHQAKPILDALDGCSTLRQIEERFGQKALDFVGSLYQKGFVELKISCF